MKRRNFLKFISLSLIFPNISFAGLLDYFKKSKEELPPEGKYTPEDKLFIVDIKGVPPEVKNLNLKEYKLKVFWKG